MAIGFTPREMAEVRRKLKAFARQSIIHTGMQKITIAQLTKAAGVSPGAFYKFYDSKELLFFEIMEDIHTDLAESINRALLEASHLPAAERLVQAMLGAIRFMDEMELMRFLREDIESILLKTPEDVLAKHYHSHDVHVRDALKGSGIQLKVPDDVLMSLVHVLMFSLNHRAECGTQYGVALEVLVRSACQFALTGIMPGTV